MKKYLSIALTFFIFLLPAFLGSQESEEPSEPVAACCFEHANYQGTCVVTPGEGETCESILEYLNTPGTVSKTYCGGTRIRGGWTLVECEQEE
jgi:hypothetical protein